ncbi:hypothetical protein XELAEV_18002189mg [Xenopus laevis]|nr:hypothetical protein XELAEV_18002189mg [Xenopus laevis]
MPHTLQANVRGESQDTSSSSAVMQDIGSAKLTVWIIGHSFVHRAVRRAEARTYGTNLDFKEEQLIIKGMGLRAAKWSDVLTILYQMSTRWGTPNILVIHLGGNDVGKTKTIDLIRIIRRDLAHIHFLMPDTVVVWSEVIPRLIWNINPELKP